ncbi:MAG: hypothetical protein WCT19_03280 [Candidatus Paceibacterota bacterium]
MYSQQNKNPDQSEINKLVEEAIKKNPVESNPPPSGPEPKKIPEPIPNKIFPTNNPAPASNLVSKFPTKEQMRKPPIKSEIKIIKIDNSTPKSPVGPIVGSIIVITVILIGGLYFWGKYLAEQGNQTATENISDFGTVSETGATQ